MRRTAVNLSLMVYQPWEHMQKCLPHYRVSDAQWIANEGTECLVGTYLTEDFEVPTTVVAFRGTKIDNVELTLWDVITGRALPKARRALADVFRNLEAYQVTRTGFAGYMHAGFYRATDKVLEELDSAVRRLGHPSIMICGHSAGGALAHLYANHLSCEKHPAKSDVVVCTFGAPASMDEYGARATERSCAAIHNYHYCADIVPRLLSRRHGYIIPGRKLYYDRRRRYRPNAGPLLRVTDRSIARMNDFGKPGLVDIKHHQIMRYTTLSV